MGDEYDPDSIVKDEEASSGGAKVKEEEEEEEEGLGFDVVTGKSDKSYRFKRGENTWTSSSAANAEGDAKEDLGDDGEELRLGNVRSAFDVDIDTLPSKPWRRKGADPSDYFNYDFDEASWKQYRKEQLERLAKSRGFIPMNVPGKDAAPTPSADPRTMMLRQQQMMMMMRQRPPMMNMPLMTQQSMMAAQQQRMMMMRPQQQPFATAATTTRRDVRPQRRGRADQESHRRERRSRSRSRERHRDNDDAGRRDPRRRRQRR